MFFSISYIRLGISLRPNSAEKNFVIAWLTCAAYTIYQIDIACEEAGLLIYQQGKSANIASQTMVVIYWLAYNQL